MGMDNFERIFAKFAEFEMREGLIFFEVHYFKEIFQFQKKKKKHIMYTSLEHSKPAHTVLQPITYQPRFPSQSPATITESRVFISNERKRGSASTASTTSRPPITNLTHYRERVCPGARCRQLAGYSVTTRARVASTLHLHTDRHARER